MTGAVKILSSGYRTDLMLLDWSGSEITDHGDHLVIRTPENPGYWWGNFLLLRDPIGAGESGHWHDRFRAEFAGATHLALGIDGVDGRSGEIENLLAQKVTVSTDMVLIADRLAPTRDSDADIRQLITDDDWSQAYDLRLACSDLDATAENELFLKRRQAADRFLVGAGHGAWFGAFVDGRLRSSAGIFSDDSGLARYQLVETHPDFRRRGLASQVVYRAGSWAISERAAERLVIVADPDYHAITIYRSLGFVDAERQVRLQRGDS